MSTGDSQQPVRKRSLSESVRKSLGRIPSFSLGKLSKPKLNVPKPPKLTGFTLLRANKKDSKSAERVPCPDLPEAFPKEFILWLNEPVESVVTVEVLDRAKTSAEEKGFIADDEEFTKAYDEAKEVADKAQILITKLGTRKFNNVMKPQVQAEGQHEAMLTLMANLPGCKFIISNSPATFPAPFSTYTPDELAKSGFAPEELDGKSVLLLNGSVADPTSLAPLAGKLSDNQDLSEFIRDAAKAYPVVFIDGSFAVGETASDLLSDLAENVDAEAPRRNIALVPEAVNLEEVDVDTKFLVYTPDEVSSQTVEFLAKVAVRDDDETLTEGQIKFVADKQKFDPVPKSKAIFKWSEEIPAQWFEQQKESLAAKKDLVVRLLIKGEDAFKGINEKNVKPYKDLVEFIEEQGTEKFDIKGTNSEGEFEIYFLKKKGEGNVEHHIMSVAPMAVYGDFSVQQIEVGTSVALKKVGRFEENWVSSPSLVEKLKEVVYKISPKEEKKEEVVEEKVEEAKVEEKAEEKKEEVKEEAKVEEKKEEVKEEVKEEEAKEDKKELSKEEKKELKKKEKEAKKAEALRKKQEKAEEKAKKMKEKKAEKEAAKKAKAEAAAKKKADKEAPKEENKPEEKVEEAKVEEKAEEKKEEVKEEAKVEEKKEEVKEEVKEEEKKEEPKEEEKKELSKEEKKELAKKEKEAKKAEAAQKKKEKAEAKEAALKKKKEEKEAKKAEAAQKKKEKAEAKEAALKKKKEEKEAKKAEAAQKKKEKDEAKAAEKEAKEAAKKDKAEAEAKPAEEVKA